MRWLAERLQRAKGQREAIEKFAKSGGSVSYDSEVDANGNPLSNAQPPTPEWLRGLLGNDFLDNVVYVNLFGCAKVTDAGLADLAGLTQLQGLRLDNTPITDAGLANFHVRLNPTWASYAPQSRVQGWQTLQGCPDSKH